MRRVAVRAVRFRPGSSKFEIRNGTVIFKSSLLLFAFLSIAIQMASAQTQTRPRRVSDRGQGLSTQTSLPPRAPVLNGGNSSGATTNTQSRRQLPDGPEEVSAGDIIRVNTALVTLPVSVMDRNGKYIPNLRKEDFRLWDEGIEQQVAYFASTEQPFTVVLMIDTSGSTHFKLEEIQDAAIAFVNQLQPNDRVTVVSFDDKIRFHTESPTADRRVLREAILKTRTGGGTRLYDAVDQVINRYLNHIQGRKAIVLFTDGVDTTSRRSTFEDNIHDAEELDALVYPVQFDTFGDLNTGVWPGSPRGPSSRSIILGNILGSIIIGGGRGGGGWPGGVGFPGGGPGTSREEYRIGDQYLHALAAKTGARVYNADQDLTNAFALVAEELRRQYSLGYYPKPIGQPGERHHIRVRATRWDVVVRARESYIYQTSANSTAQTSEPTAPILRKTQ